MVSAKSVKNILQDKVNFDFKNWYNRNNRPLFIECPFFIGPSTAIQVSVITANKSGLEQQLETKWRTSLFGERKTSSKRRGIEKGAHFSPGRTLQEFFRQSELTFTARSRETRVRDQPVDSRMPTSRFRSHSLAPRPGARRHGVRIVPQVSSRPSERAEPDNPPSEQVISVSLSLDCSSIYFLGVGTGSLAIRKHANDAQLRYRPIT